MRRLPPPPRRLRHVDRDVLAMIAERVDGQWGRVTADDSGAITIHNQAQHDDSPPPPKRAAVRTARPRKSARAAPSSPPVLAGLLARPQPPQESDAPAPPVQQEPRMQLAPQPAPQRIDQAATPSPSREPIWIKIPGIRREGDWERAGLARTAHELSKQLRRGVPAEATLTVNAEVLALDGIDIEAAEAVARNPQQVKIAKETADKKYPVLTFHRGDITIVVGFRIPHTPQIIAAYFTGDALKEYRRNRDSVGGGGARKGEGVPRHPRLLRKRLEEMGATVETDRDHHDPDKDATTATVTYRGDVLGKISLTNYTARTVASDWQRMQRRITAIRNRREAS